MNHPHGAGEHRPSRHEVVVCDRPRLDVQDELSDSGRWVSLIRVLGQGRRWHSFRQSSWSTWQRPLHPRRRCTCEFRESAARRRWGNDGTRAGHGGCHHRHRSGAGRRAHRFLGSL